MARKRTIPARPPTSAPAAPPHETAETAAADAADCQPKIDNLKALNGLLVKETMESREQIRELRAQIDALSADNTLLAALGGDITAAALCGQLASARERWNSDRREREAVLAGAVELARREKDEAQAQMMAAVTERDAIRAKLEESKELKSVLEVKFNEMVMKAKVADDNLRRVQEECASLKDDGKENDAAVQSLLVEKTALEKNVADLTESVKVLRRDTERVSQEKENELVMLRTELGQKVENAHEECVALKGKIEEKDAELRLLSLENSDLERSVSHLTQSMEEMKERMERAVQGKEDELQMVRSELVQKVEDAEEAYASLKHTEKQLLERNQEEKRALEIRLGEMEMKVKEADDPLRSAQTECLILKDENNEKDVALQSLSMEKTVLESRIAELTLVAEGLKRDMEQAVREREGELDTVRAEFGKKVKDAEETIVSLNESQERYRDDMNRLKQESELLKEDGEFKSCKLSELAKANAELDEAVRGLTEDRARLQEEADGLKHEGVLNASKIKELEKSKLDLQEEVEKVRAEFGKKVKDAEETIVLLNESQKRYLDDLDRLKQESELLKEDGEFKSCKLSELAKANAELDEAVRSLTEDRTRLQEEADGLKHEGVLKASIIKELEKSKLDLQEEVEKFNIDFEKLKESYSLLEKEEEAKTLKVAELLKVNGELQEEVGRLNADGVKLADRNNLLILEKKSLSSEVSELEKTKEKLLDEVTTLNSHIAGYKEDIRLLKLQLDQNEVKVSEVEQIKLGLESDMTRLTLEMEAVREQYEEEARSLVLSNRSLSERVDEVVRRLELVAAEKSGAEQVKAIQETELLQMRTTAQKLKSAVKELEGLSARQAQENESLQVEKDSLLKRLHQQMEKSVQEVGQLRAELKALQGSVTEEKKKSGIWAVVSSASALVAALSLGAYANSKGH